MLEEVIIRFGTELEKEKLLTDYPNIQNVIGDGGYFIIAAIKDTVVGYLWAFRRKIPAPVEQSEIFINIIEVIRTNFGGFFEKLGNLSGSVTEKVAPLMKAVKTNTESSI